MNALEKWDKTVADYLTDCKYRGVSDKTLDNYTKRLRMFREFWTEHGDTSSEPTTKDFENWRNYLIDNGKNPSTVAQYLMEVRYFYNNVTDEELGENRPYEKNPVLKRLMPKVQKKPYDNLVPDDKVALLWNRDNYSNIKSYAITVFLLCTKIRNSELRNLTLNDLDFENEEIIIRHGKGDKARIVDFDKMAQSVIRMYLLSNYRPMTVSADDLLFGSKSAHTFGYPKQNDEDWHTLSPQALSNIVERQVQKITGIDHIRTHDLRHIGSRIALNSRAVSMEELQAELGHSDMATTKIYSGRLILGKRNKKAVNEVLEEKNRQLERNLKMIEKMEEKERKLIERMSKGTYGKIPTRIIEETEEDSENR